jgi:hypothetical protein
VETKLKIGDAAPDADVLDSHGQPISLADVWPAGPTLLTFLRHFG